MKLRILAHRTNAGAAEMLIDNIKLSDERNLAERRIIIVPERVSFAAESEILKSVGATFAAVYTFRRFADLILPQSEFLSEASSVIALTGIVAKNRDKLICYKKGVDSYGFVKNLYEIIGQLKYSLISPNELAKSNPPPFLRAKIKDISLLYSEYEEFTRDKLNDASDRLNALIKALPNVEWLQRAHFCFLDFDNFSAQEAMLIKEFVKHSASVTVACAYSSDRRHGMLYPNEIYDRTMEIAAGLVAPEIIIESRLDSETDYKTSRLFSADINSTAEKRRNASVNIYAASGVDDEIESLAQHIVRGVMKGARYDDYTVVACNTDSHASIKRVFGRFQIPCYISQKFTLNEHCLGRYISDFVKVFKNNYSAADVVSFVKNFMFDAGEDAFAFERYIQKYNISHNFSEPFIYNSPEKIAAERVRARLLDTTTVYKLIKYDYAENYARRIKELIKASADALDRYSRLEADAVMSAFTAQVKEKAIELAEQIERILKGVRLSVEEFSRLLDSSMNAVRLSVIPQTKHCVNVVPIEHARQHSAKYICIVGAAEGAFPAIIGDFNLLDDKSLSLLNEINVKIEPSARALNRRARFGVYQLLLEPCEELYLSCPDISTASIAFKQMQRLYAPNEKNCAVYPARYAAEYRLLSDSAKGDYVNSPALFYALGKPEITRDCTINSIDNGKAVLIPKNTVSVSRVETFYSCPYKHFLQYGMRLREVERFELDPLRFGTLLHEILEKYFRALITDSSVYLESEKDHKFRIGEIYAQMLADDESYSVFLRNPQMKAFLDRLAVEASQAAYLMREYIKESDFKPAFVELEFGRDGEFRVGDFFLRGKIDRIDVYKDMAAIFDYKSSETIFSDAKFNAGTSLQLVTYVSALNKLNLRCAGFYYAGISEKNKKGAVSFSGKSLYDRDVLESLDYNVKNRESKRLGVRLNKDDSIAGSSRVLTAEELDLYVQEAHNKIISAAESMSKGIICPAPFDNVCTYCPYKPVCGFKDTT